MAHMSVRNMVVLPRGVGGYSGMSSVCSPGKVLDHWGQGEQFTEKMICQLKREAIGIRLPVSFPQQTVACYLALSCCILVLSGI